MEKEPVFNEAQMLRLVEQDAYLLFVYGDLQKRGHLPMNALEVIFNSNVLEDSLYTEQYNKCAISGETIVKMLEISASHISKDSKEWLDAEEDRVSLTIFEKPTYGWIILVPQNASKVAALNKVPATLRTVVEHAFQQGCKWIMLDVVAPIIPELPTYEW